MPKKKHEYYEVGGLITSYLSEDSTLYWNTESQLVQELRRYLLTSILNTLNVLTVKQFEAVEMVHLEGKTTVQVGRELGVNQSAISLRLNGKSDNSGAYVRLHKKLLEMPGVKMRLEILRDIRGLKHG